MGICSSSPARGNKTLFESVGISSNLRQKVSERITHNEIITDQKITSSNKIKITASKDALKITDSKLFQNKIKLYTDPHPILEFWKQPTFCGEFPEYGCMYDPTQNTNVKITSFSSFSSSDTQDIFNDVKQEVIKNNNSDLSGIKNDDIEKTFNDVKDVTVKKIKSYLDKQATQSQDFDKDIIIEYNTPIKCVLKNCKSTNPKVVQNIQAKIMSTEIITMVVEEVLKSNINLKTKMESKKDTSNNTCLYALGIGFTITLIILFFVVRSVVFSGGGKSGGGRKKYIKSFFK
jgi:hypothetical protein